MKTRNLPKSILLLSLLMLFCSSCDKKAKDKEIKADLTVKAKEDVDFAGVQFMVNNGTVTLMGNCISEKSRQGSFRS